MPRGDDQGQSTKNTVGKGQNIFAKVLKIALYFQNSLILIKDRDKIRKNVGCPEPELELKQS